MTVNDVRRIYLSAVAEARLIRSTRKLKRKAVEAAARTRGRRPDDPDLPGLQARRNALRDELAQRGVEVTFD
jgi:hypothetical protein